MAKKNKLNFYATINRGKTNKHGTKIRLSWEKNPLIMSFLKSKHQEMIALHKSNPDSVPSFGMEEEDWEKIRKELGEKNHDFTKVYFGADEICVLCHKKFRTEIMDFEILRQEARRQEEVKKELEEQEEKKKKRKKKKDE
jgi:hypothetical protein